MIIAGLTGGIACGKSKVSLTFVNHNIPVIDADILSRDVVKPGSQGWFELFLAYGKDYFNSDGQLNRPKLAELIFSSSKEIIKINAIMQPLIMAAANRWFGYYRLINQPLILFDAALIIEQSLIDRVYPLIVVSCGEEIQISRLIKRNNLTREAALARLAVQMPTKEKIKFADFIIDTSGSIDNSIKQTEIIIQHLINLSNK